MKACQNGYQCHWGSKQEQKVICQFAKCVVKRVPKTDEYEDQLLHKRVKV